MLRAPVRKTAAPNRMLVAVLGWRKDTPLVRRRTLGLPWRPKTVGDGSIARQRENLDLPLAVDFEHVIDDDVSGISQCREICDCRAYQDF